ncbi:MAG: hypothetical protein M3N97_14830 [Pseudomonadota bacterium]|nr:hypothetical protein [Pseudomonadota bacterium]
MNQDSDQDDPYDEKLSDLMKLAEAGDVLARSRCRGNVERARQINSHQPGLELRRSNTAHSDPGTGLCSRLFEPRTAENRFRHAS